MVPSFSIETRKNLVLWRKSQDDSDTAGSGLAFEPFIMRGAVWVSVIIMESSVLVRMELFNRNWAHLQEMAPGTHFLLRPWDPEAVAA